MLQLHMHDCVYNSNQKSTIYLIKNGWSVVFRPRLCYDMTAGMASADLKALQMCIYQPDK